MKTITMTELNSRIQAANQKGSKDEVFLDVREPSEFAEGHVPGSLNIPVGEVGRRHQELKPFKTIYIHCRSGRRAQNATAELHGLGFTNLVCIANGGMPEWEQAGYPVERGLK